MLLYFNAVRDGDDTFRISSKFLEILPSIEHVQYLRKNLVH